MKQAAEKEQANSKPLFMTKSMREKLKHEEKEKEAEEYSKKLYSLTKEHDKFIQASKEDAKERERKEREARREERERKEREREKDKDKDKDKDSKPMPVIEEGDEREKEKELKNIKDQYLGLRKEKKKIIKPSEKFKFVFAWDLSEDTSRDINPIYNNKVEVRPQFGRGFICFCMGFK